MATPDPFDILVIGAGIQGAGVAQAAAAAGHRVLVLERDAPAAGTSRRSTKLIHGGLRYLETGQLRLVREALGEQALLLRNAPDLVRPIRLWIPVYRHTSRSPGRVHLGLVLYRLLGSPLGVRRLSPRRWDNPDGLTTRDLLAVFALQEAQTDDSALTRAVLRSAESLGAQVRYPAEVTEIVRRPDGWEVAYRQGGHGATCRGLTLVNAAGPWVNQVLARMTPRPPELALDLVQGSHLILPWNLSGDGYYGESPRDGRGVFMLPWEGDRTLVGTTETPFSGDPDQARPLPAEIAYLQEVVAQHLPGRALAPVSAFAGLRVLPGGPSSPFVRHRETLIATEANRPPRLVTVCGGKLTTYRAAAEQVLTRLGPALPVRSRRGDTRQLPLRPDCA